MSWIKKIGYHIALLLLVQTAFGCNNKQPKNQEPAKNASAVNKPIAVNTKTIGDEQLFRICLAKFKNAVKGKNKTEIKSLFNFPLQTLPQWTNDEVKNSITTPQDGMIKQTEFLTYFDDIFTKDDKGSTLFELQKQYAQDNGQETSFGFVFGKVRGIYKIISYYRPWPLK